MALSQKTVELDTIIVETLFNRGVPLSTSQTYIATVSPFGPFVPSISQPITLSCECTPMTKPAIGQFLQWTNQPLSTIYHNYFYGINPKDLVDQLARIESDGSAAVAAYTSASNTVVDLGATTIQAYSNINYANSSTISSYYSSIAYDSPLSIQRFNAINNTLESASTVIMELSTNFYTTQFLPYANTLIQRGDYYYLVRPIPLPTPVPWYWQGDPSRYIGPGLSSMYISTVLNQDLINSDIRLLSTTSTSWGWSNSTIIDDVASYIDYTITAVNYIDSGSSISTSLGDYTSTFNGHLITEFYGTDVSTISTFVTDYFTSYIVPTDGPYISTGASSMFTMLSTLNSTTIGHISSGLLGDNISTFSTIEAFEMASVITTLYTSQNYPTLSSLYYDFSTIIISTANLVLLSTNQAGYENLSTVAQTMFSSFSTLFPVLLGSNTLYTTSTFNSTLRAFSSILVPQNSTIYGLNAPYIAAPGLSSLNSNLSTYTQNYYLMASADISTQSTILQYSTVIYQSYLNSAANWYSSYTVLTDYSTIYDTLFHTIQTIGVKGISSATVSTLGIGDQVQGKGQVLAIQGGVQLTEAMAMSNFTIYNSNEYTIGIKQLESYVSTLLFNSSFIICQPVGYSSLVGINTIPAYALDIKGDARKLTGTQWINPSDERIKHAISDVDTTRIIEQISGLRLVSYTWSDNYRAAHALQSNRVLGFLSQDVEAIFPDAVTSAVEEGFVDFKSLNTDQLMKAKFALTRHLLFRVSTLQSRLNNLR